MSVNYGGGAGIAIPRKPVETEIEEECEYVDIGGSMWSYCRAYCRAYCAVSILHLEKSDEDKKLREMRKQEGKKPKTRKTKLQRLGLIEKFQNTKSKIQIPKYWN